METPEATKRQAAFLATFQCHKRVQAGRIVALDLHPGQMWVKVEAKPWAGLGVDPAGEAPTVVFPIDATMLVRFDPHPGDYAVVYDGGYLSFSPRQAFEEGYKRWPDPSLPSGVTTAGEAAALPQNDETISLVNQNKAFEEMLLQRLDKLAADPDTDKRWLAIGRTQLEQAFMAINRAIFKPERAKL